jgi:hypothetical protein
VRRSSGQDLALTFVASVVSGITHELPVWQPTGLASWKPSAMWPALLLAYEVMTAFFLKPSMLA